MKPRPVSQERSTALSFLDAAPDRRERNCNLRFPFLTTSARFSSIASYQTMAATTPFATIRRRFFAALALLAAVLAAPALRGEEAPLLDAERARVALGIRHRNPVKSSSPIVKRTYERRPAKGLDVETMAAAPATGADRGELVDVKALATAPATGADRGELVDVKTVAAAPATGADRGELVDVETLTAAPATGADRGELVDVEIVHREDGSTEVRPFVALPILFVANSDQLLDEISRRNVEAMATVLRELSSRGPTHFAVQGHTSAEGTRDSNQILSERRAARIEALLVAKGVEAKTLSAVGLGEDASRFPEPAPEPQRQEDRRVLIVRMR
jgi:outer membrane protein OmpA-like peptidoglycan-associated protein